MKRVLLLPVIFALSTILTSVRAMELKKAPVTSSNNSVLEKNEKDPTTVEPFFANPLKEIPQYIFANCNQVTLYNWKPETFKTIKAFAPKATAQAIKKKYPQDFIKNAETYDWIYALSYLEDEYIKTGKNFVQSLSVDEIKKINGKITRFTNDNAGKLRQRNIIWQMKDFEPEELILFKYLDSIKQSHFLGQNRFGIIYNPITGDMHLSGIKKLLEEYKQKHKIFIPKEECFFDQDALVTYFNEQTKKPLPVNFDDINPEKTVNEWAKQYPGTEKNTMSYFQWYKERCHNFPPSHMVSQKTAEAIKSIKGHPIEQAARIWLETVRIHVSDEANKRTGKALASIILLQNGYLPPLITKEDSERYKIVLEANLNNGEEGFKHFLSFVIEMIEKTQELYKDKLQ